MLGASTTLNVLFHFYKNARQRAFNRYFKSAWPQFNTRIALRKTLKSAFARQQQDIIVIKYLHDAPLEIDIQHSTEVLAPP